MSQPWRGSGKSCRGRSWSEKCRGGGTTYHQTLKTRRLALGLTTFPALLGSSTGVDKTTAGDFCASPRYYSQGYWQSMRLWSSNICSVQDHGDCQQSSQDDYLRYPGHPEIEKLKASHRLNPGYGFLSKRLKNLTCFLDDIYPHQHHFHWTIKAVILSD